MFLGFYDGKFGFLFVVYQGDFFYGEFLGV